MPARPKIVGESLGAEHACARLLRAFQNIAFLRETVAKVRRWPCLDIGQGLQAGLPRSLGAVRYPSIHAVVDGCPPLLHVHDPAGRSQGHEVGVHEHDHGSLTPQQNTWAGIAKGPPERLVKPLSPGPGPSRASSQMALATCGSTAARQSSKSTTCTSETRQPQRPTQLSRSFFLGCFCGTTSQRVLDGMPNPQRPETIFSKVSVQDVREAQPPTFQSLLQEKSQLPSYSQHRGDEGSALFCSSP